MYILIFFFIIYSKRKVARLQADNTPVTQSRAQLEIKKKGALTRQTKREPVSDKPKDKTRRLFACFFILQTKKTLRATLWCQKELAD